MTTSPMRCASIKSSGSTFFLTLLFLLPKRRKDFSIFEWKFCENFVFFRPIFFDEVKIIFFEVELMLDGSFELEGKHLNCRFHFSKRLQNVFLFFFSCILWNVFQTKRKSFGFSMIVLEDFEFLVGKSKKNWRFIFLHSQRDKKEISFFEKFLWEGGDFGDGYVFGIQNKFFLFLFFQRKLFLERFHFK